MAEQKNIVKHIRLTPELASNLKVQATREDVPESTIIRRAIREYILQRMEPPIEAKDKRRVRKQEG